MAPAPAPQDPRRHSALRRGRLVPAWRASPRLRRNPRAGPRLRRRLLRLPGGCQALASPPSPARAWRRRRTPARPPHAPHPPPFSLRASAPQRRAAVCQRAPRRSAVRPPAVGGARPLAAAAAVSPAPPAPPRLPPAPQPPALQPTSTWPTDRPDRSAAPPVGGVASARAPRHAVIIQ